MSKFYRPPPAEKPELSLFQQLAQEQITLAALVLRSIMLDPDPPAGTKFRLAAIKEILDRVDGRPAITVNQNFQVQERKSDKIIEHIQDSEKREADMRLIAHLISSNIPLEEWDDEARQAYAALNKVELKIHEKAGDMLKLIEQ